MDSRVLLDLLTDDPRWAAWSAAMLEQAATAGPIGINDVIDAEISVRFAVPEALDAFLADAGVARLPMSGPALFLAARAHARYRARGGTRSGVLADFCIGAQAAVEGWSLPLLTRDTRRYRSAFPGLDLIAPEGSESSP
ncbi:type II toxin-antitoxin system VapC family toxin [Falsiroseomonas selenitidurans]|uniref:type II toxin-antitoxin system VapC family toxin n=1 Tax=Falsiroseomonas selenitidurans TaxID=2716335 RepID=UPI002E2C62C5|nr:DNA-binding protein [Falsiroseomonas selenitidurans]